MLRRLGLAAALSAFGALLVLLVIAVSLNHVLGTPGYLKRSFQESGVYDRLVEDILNQGRAAGDQAEAGRLPLEREEVRQAAREAFPPELLQRSANTIIDSTYEWLQGKSDKPQFEVDLAPAKADFANRIGSYARARLAGLPACTGVPATTDPFEITCRPPGVNLEPEIRRLTSELATTDEYLADPVITADDLTVSQAGKQVPYYQAGVEWPQLFGRMRLAPFVVGLLAALTAVAVIALSRPRKHGVTSLAVALVTTGVVTLGAWWLLGNAADALGRRVAEAPIHAEDFVRTSLVSSLVTTLERTLSGVVLLFALLYIGLGILMLIIVKLLARRRLGITQPADTSDSVVDTQPPDTEQPTN